MIVSEEKRGEKVAHAGEVTGNLRNGPRQYCRDATAVGICHRCDAEKMRGSGFRWLDICGKHPKEPGMKRDRTDDDIGNLVFCMQNSKSMLYGREVDKRDPSYGSDLFRRERKEKAEELKGRTRLQTSLV